MMLLIIYLELLQQLLEYDKLESIENVFKITQKMYFPILPFKYVDELSTYNDFFNMKLLDKQYSELKSSGYVVDTLFSAIWCFYYSAVNTNHCFWCFDNGYFLCAIWVHVVMV